jgi:hypothetical protein
MVMVVAVEGASGVEVGSEGAQEGGRGATHLVGLPWSSPGPAHFMRWPAPGAALLNSRAVGLHRLGTAAQCGGGMCMGCCAQAAGSGMVPVMLLPLAALGTFARQQGSGGGGVAVAERRPCCCSAVGGYVCM